MFQIVFIFDVIFMYDVVLNFENISICELIFIS